MRTIGRRIGASRTQEIVTNIVLPFVAAYAENTGDRKLYETAKARYARLPAAPSNSIVRLAGGQLFHSILDSLLRATVALVT